MSRRSDPGVPEALPRTLAHVREALGAESLERLWIFPPFARGRRESGLVALSCYVEHDDRRRLFTAAYTAERSGLSLVVEPALREEGLAPLDRFPRVMNGVVRRSLPELGDPREVEIGGDPEALARLIEELEERAAAEAP